MLADRRTDRQTYTDTLISHHSAPVALHRGGVMKQNDAQRAPTNDVTDDVYVPVPCNVDGCRPCACPLPVRCHVTDDVYVPVPCNVDGCRPCVCPLPVRCHVTDDVYVPVPCNVDGCRPCACPLPVRCNVTDHINVPVPCNVDGCRPCACPLPRDGLHQRAYVTDDVYVPVRCNVTGVVNVPVRWAVADHVYTCLSHAT